MSDHEKYPLVMVDSDGGIRRVHGDMTARVLCPYGSNHWCSYYCAAIAAFDNGSDLPGIVCQSHGRNVPIGLADPESFDLEKLEALMAGSALLEQIEATKKRESTPGNAAE